MEQDPCVIQKLVGVVDALAMDPNYGDRVGFDMCKWTLLVIWSLETPYLQPEGLKTFLKSYHFYTTHFYQSLFLC
jgi:hypothetical protein